MKKFVFHKYLKYISSISEWPSSIYTFNKRNIFLLNNNEKKAYELIYHYFNSNLTYKKTAVNKKFINLKSIYIKFFSKFILNRFNFVNNVLNLFYPKKNNLLFFSDNENISNDKILIKKTLRLNRLLKYRLRRKFFLKII